MSSVTITELKAHLSEYLRRVRSGERFHITRRGVEIAELGPPDPVRVALWSMVDAGMAEWSGEDAVLPDDLPVNPGRSLSELIAEDRGPHLPDDTSSP
jgi:prevent-host-death family protein